MIKQQLLIILVLILLSYLIFEFTAVHLELIPTKSQWTSMDDPRKAPADFARAYHH